jgi:hypothetical protein
MKWWMVLLAIVVVVALALLIWACYEYVVKKDEDIVCRDVQVSAPPKDVFNVLFLGDGFKGEDALNTYRAAVYHLANYLVEKPPFCHYQDRINIYRIDVEDPQGGISEAPCPSGTTAVTPMGTMGLPPAVPPVIGNEGVASTDLEVTRCWTGNPSATGSTYVLWMESGGLKEAYRLAGLAPSISLVVVIANVAHGYGAGYSEVWSGSIGLVVVGVPQECDAVTGKCVIDDAAYYLLSHEFGHGLGLLDEYNYGGKPSVTFPDQRNVWEPEPTWPAVITSSINRSIPWEDAMERPGGNACTSADMEACYGYSSAACASCLCPGVNPECVYVPRACQDPSMYCHDNPCPGLPPYPPPMVCPSHVDPTKDLFPPTECNKYPGAWEGAYYTPKGYYRARNHCRMQEIEGAFEFCEACAIYIHKYLCSYGDPNTCVPDWGTTMGGC